MDVLLAAIAAGLLALAFYSAWYAARVAGRFPPRGSFIEIEGVRIHYVEMGVASADAAPIVLVHGASGNLGDMVESIMPELAKRHRVIAFDRPGHGWSERPGGDDASDPAAQARLLHEALAKLGIERPVLLGHSWGGALATAYALRFPDDLSGLLVLSGATHVWEGADAWYHRIIATPLVGSLFLHVLMVPGGLMLMEAGIRNNFAPDPVPPRYAERIGLPLLFRPRQFRANSADTRRLRGFLREQSGRYGEIRVPTIIVTGNRDRTVWAKLHSYALHDAIAGSEMIKLVGVGHMPHHVRPDIVIDALSRLARGVPPRAGTHVVEPGAPLR